MSTLAPTPSIAHFALLLGLTTFFGLAYEELTARGGPPRPGGIRTFPLLALLGALLYLLEPHQALPYATGLVVLGSFLAIYYWHHIGEKDAEGRPNVSLAPPFSNALAYALGPVCLVAPPWVAVAVTVAAVLLLMEREQLHRFAWGLPMEEILTAGKFLVLTGVILPLLPQKPFLPFSTITPQQIWLAVLAVCTLSYASYLLQRYVVRRDSGLWIAVLGGMYSSTAATVALARNVRSNPNTAHTARTGIVLATAVMYLRLLVIIALFDLELARRLAPALVALAVLGGLLAWGVHLLGRRQDSGLQPSAPPRNPLELVAAFVFAALYVVISVASTWVKTAFGMAGLFWLAMAVGLTDIDPFVLSLAQGGTATLSLASGAAAILIAASSNNLLKAGYAAVFAGVRPSLPSGLALAALAAAGIAMAFVML